MTTLTAVSSTEVIVNNNGREMRVSVAKLIAVDESVAHFATIATRNIGQEVKVPGDNRKPRHARVHGLLQ